MKIFSWTLKLLDWWQALHYLLLSYHKWLKPGELARPKTCLSACFHFFCFGVLLWLIYGIMVNDIPVIKRQWNFSLHWLQHCFILNCSSRVEKHFITRTPILSSQEAPFQFSFIVCPVSINFDIRKSTFKTSFLNSSFIAALLALSGGMARYVASERIS